MCVTTKFIDITFEYYPKTLDKTNIYYSFLLDKLYNK